MLLRAGIYASRRIRWRIGGLWGKMVMRSYGVTFGQGLRLGSAPVIRRQAGASIALGDHVVILNELEENPAGINHRTVLAADAPGAELRIGNDVGISGAVLYALKRIAIGNHVCLGAGCAIFDSDFHPLDARMRRTKTLEGVAVSPVRIEDDVWIGARAIVLKGISIGAGSVVGAAAVVTTNVPAGMIVAGIPARIIGPVPPQT